MKKTISALLALAALLLCACGAPSAGTPTPEPTSAADEPVETAAPSVSALRFYKSTETLSEERDGTTLCTVTYPTLSLSDEDAAVYPALAAAFASLNSDGATNSTSAYGQLLSAAADDYDRRAAAESAQAAASDGAEEGGVTPFEMFYRYDDLTLPRADSRAVSILYSMTSFSGGVHGNYYYYSTNLDTATGRALSVGDVVTNMAQLRALLETALRDKYPDAGFEVMEDALNAYFADPASITWTLDYQGISFFFSHLQC